MFTVVDFSSETFPATSVALILNVFAPSPLRRIVPWYLLLMNESGVQFPPSVWYSTFEIPESPFSVTSTLTWILEVLYHVSVPTDVPSDVISTSPTAGFCVSTVTVLVSWVSLPEISFAIIVNSLVPSATKFFSELLVEPTTNSWVQFSVVGLSVTDLLVSPSFHLIVTDARAFESEAVPEIENFFVSPPFVVFPAEPTSVSSSFGFASS